MLGLCIPLNYYFGLKGSLAALFLSQLTVSCLNLFKLKNNYTILLNQSKESFDKPLLKFSFPVAMQELTYFITQWGAPLLITKYASLGEVGIYTAAAQWNAIILFIPGVLSNVVLSYLSTTAATNEQSHKTMIKRMLLINFVCSAIPFLIVFTLSSVIVSFYGKTFVGMRSVLNILIFSTIFTCLSNVFTSDLISQGKNWLLFILRASRDIIILVLLFFVLQLTNGINAAMNFAIINVVVAIAFLLMLLICYRTKL